MTKTELDALRTVLELAIWANDRKFSDAVEYRKQNDAIEFTTKLIEEISSMSP